MQESVSLPRILGKCLIMYANVHIIIVLYKISTFSVQPQALKEIDELGDLLLLKK